MLKIQQIDTLRERLRKVSDIVDMQARRELKFPEAVVTWLAEAENDLEESRLAVVGPIAALRSRLLTSLHRCSADGSGGRISRKVQEAMASSVLQEAQQYVSNSLAFRLQQIEQAESLALELISIARAKGVMDEVSQVRGHQEALVLLRQMLRDDADTIGHVVRLEGLVGLYDALVLLDRAAPELNS